LKDALESCIIFLALSKYDNHQSDMMHRVKKILETEEGGLDELLTPAYLGVLTLFTTKEIMPFPFPGQEELQAHACLQRHIKGVTDQEGTTSFWLKTLHTRVVQHNLRVASGYYTRIHTARLAGMLGLTVDELESHLSDVVEGAESASATAVIARNGAVGAARKKSAMSVQTEGDVGIYVKIDRPAGIVDFTRPRAAETVLSDWASDVHKMLSLMESTCHLINRETMVHKVA
jgi:26S proteasome regulatory subunit N5